MVSKFFNYSVDDIKKSIITNANWGSYFVIDNFLEKDLFSKLCTDFNFQKVEDNSIFTGIEPPRAWRFTEPRGSNLIIGGAGAGVSHFDKLCSLSKTWKEFIEVIHSDESHKYFFIDIFSDTSVYKNNISNQDLKDSIISCKLSSQLNNYGDIIHPDNRQKVISYLLYLDTYGWDENSVGGTDLWEVLDKEVEYDRDESSMDYKFRNGRYSPKHPNVRLTEDEAERIQKFKSIDFKPNRMVGFVRNNKSYHSIPPRILPEGITRDCFQVNIWNLRSRQK